MGTTKPNSIGTIIIEKQSSCRLTVMEVAVRVALTGLGCIPFTPRTPFETWVLGSKARSKTASQAWTGPHGGWNYGQPAAAT